jgi:hypothetical protein
LHELSISQCYLQEFAVFLVTQNILVQIRCEILSDPNAQLDLNNANLAYTESEAKAAFTRMVQRYGWDKS